MLSTEPEPVAASAGDVATGGLWQLVILAKAPVPGKVKTRLCPPLTPLQASRVAAAAIADTVAAGLGSAARRCTVALDGSPGEWLPSGTAVISQGPGTLGARIEHALADAWQQDPVPVLLVGMDTPQVTAALLDRVAGVLLADPHRAVLGPAEDGGFWVIGVPRPLRGLFDGVPMSSARTFLHQGRRLDDLGQRWTVVPGLRDVDDVDDAESVADLAPGTRFAAAFRSVGVAASATNRR